MTTISKQHILDVLGDSRLDFSTILLDDDKILKIQEFCELLQKWNDKINLISEKTSLSILEKHIFDSLQYIRWLNPSHKTLDIGSGAGFPGLPIKIIYPEQYLILLESQRKRCNFLREAIRTLNLEKIEVAEGRYEEFSNEKTFSGVFDCILFRGFSSFDACVTAGMPFLKEQGRIILKKGPEEIPDSSVIQNGRIIETKEVEGYDGYHSIMIVVEKCST